ncbi:hypothetical protein AC578_1115 [Pseudocercospora eumusae]|uniref:Uncharacterized protein n=1 Tax=Pseudocercospora eumusae TaxID=321146 RepID=A0A139HTN7_9PEZI|nr:hypothetical protein AC578_1115 [Pseudocercospora eumusae]
MPKGADGGTMSHKSLATTADTHGITGLCEHKDAETAHPECSSHMLCPGRKREDAPEVRPSRKPILACPGHKQKQAAWNDDPKFSMSTSLDSYNATATR